VGRGCARAIRDGGQRVQCSPFLRRLTIDGLCGASQTLSGRWGRSDEWLGRSLAPPGGWGWGLRGLGGFHGLGGGVCEVGGGDDGEAAFEEHFAAEFYVGAFEADDEGDAEFDGLGGVDDALGDDVAFHDAAEDVDEDGLDFGVGAEDAEGFADLFFFGAAADVEEVGGVSAALFDDVHGGHGEAGAVDHAGDVSIKADVVEIKFPGFDFAGVFFGEVAVGDDLGVAEEGVVVEIEFGVEGEDFAGGGLDEGVDLDHGAVAGHEEFVEGGEDFLEGAEFVRGEADGFAEFLALEGLEAEGGVDGFVDDFLGRVLGDFLDVDAAFAAEDDDGALGGAVEEYGEVVFLFNIHALGDEDLADEFAFGAGLMRDERLADHFAGDVRSFLGGVHQMHAALEAVHESPLAASACMDLGFDDEAFAAKRGGGSGGFLAGAGNGAAGGGDAVFEEKFFGLVFVDVHVGRDTRARGCGVNGISPVHSKAGML